MKTGVTHCGNFYATDLSCIHIAANVIQRMCKILFKIKFSFLSFHTNYNAKPPLKNKN